MSWSLAAGLDGAVDRFLDDEDLAPDARSAWRGLALAADDDMVNVNEFCVATSCVEGAELRSTPVKRLLACLAPSEVQLSTAGRIKVYSVKASTLSDVLLAWGLKKGRSFIWTRLVAAKAAHLGPKSKKRKALPTSTATSFVLAAASPPPAVASPPLKRLINFLYASPLVGWHNGKRSDIPSVNVDEEYNAIKKGLVAAANDDARHPTLLGAVAIRALPATRTNLVLIQRDGVAVFHYSGHGHKQRGLVFLGAQYNSDLVSAAEIRDLLGGVVPTVALLLTCHSKAIGEALVAVGVKHVVAVAQEVSICVGAVLLFHEAFYTLFASGHSVAMSVEQGRVAIRSSTIPTVRACADSILLLPLGADHAKVVFPTTFPPSAVVDNPFPALRTNNLPCELRMYKERNLDEFLIVSSLNDGVGAVWVHGPRGAGKTQIIKSAARMIELHGNFQFGCKFVYVDRMAQDRASDDPAALASNVMRQLVAEVEAWLAQDAPPLLESKALLVLDGLDDVAETPSFLEWLRRLCEDHAHLYFILAARQLPPLVAHMLKDHGVVVRGIKPLNPDKTYAIRYRSLYRTDSAQVNISDSDDDIYTVAL